MAARPRVVLVTGCSSGIGLAIAVAFARKGDHVVATMRDLSRAEPLRRAAADAGVELETALLDVTEPDAAPRCLDDIRSRHGRLDVVVNNAGVLVAGTLEELTLDDIRRSMEVNFFGVATLTAAALPVMRDQGEGRIIAVSSIAGAIGQPFNDAYCAAKFAVEGLYEALHPVAASFGVHISLVEPGPVAGAFRDRAEGVGGPIVGGPFAELWPRFRRVSDAGYEGAQSPKEVADVVVAVADAEAPQLRYQTSAAVARLVGVKLADPTGERITAMTARWLA
jgi:NAD(P)-dependent dehydrogenase (short-subunit alcohol dehydrogenase family)